MSLPFGIDLKSLIVGMLLVWFVVPWVLSMLHSQKSKSAQ